MDKAKVEQYSKEMTELCKNKARSAYLFAGTPVGKALYMLVLSVLLIESPIEDRYWWKPPLPPPTT